MLELRAASPLSLSEQLAFFSMMNTVVRSGMPLSIGLEHVRDGLTSSKQKAAVAVAIRVISHEGRPFHEALRRAMPDLPPLYLALIEQGESSGKLDSAIDQIAKLCEERVEMRRQVVRSLAYPVFLLGMSVLILPIPALINGTSSFFELVGPAIMAFAGLAFFGLYVWPRLFLAEGMAARRDRWLITVPLFSRISGRFATARFSHSLGTLVEAGMPLGRALPLAAAATGNRYFASRMELVTDRVMAGSSLNEALRLVPDIANPSLISMVRTGEVAGELEKSLRAAGRMLESDAKMQAGVVLKLIGPAFTVIMVIVIGYRIVGNYASQLAVIESIR